MTRLAVILVALMAERRVETARPQAPAPVPGAITARRRLLLADRRRPGQQHGHRRAPDAVAPPFKLYVSNQSFDDPNVQIAIDGVTVVTRGEVTLADRVTGDQQRLVTIDESVHLVKSRCGHRVSRNRLVIG